MQDTAAERLCWICYSTESTYPDDRWVSPCRCSGDTRWSHERCLLTWIIRKQASLSAEEDMDEQEAEEPNEMDLVGEPPFQRDERAQVPRMEGVLADNQQGHIPVVEQRRRFNAIPIMPRMLQALFRRHTERLSSVRCPQCGDRYRLEYERLPWYSRLFMPVFAFTSTIGDLATIYFVLGGVGYAVGLISRTYGAYAVTTVFGPGDPVTLAVREIGTLSGRQILGLSSVPHLMFLLQSRSSERLVFAGSVLSLGWIYGLRPLLDPASIASLSLGRKRFAMLCGVVCVRRLYQTIYSSLLVPWVIGSGRRRRRLEERGEQPAAADAIAGAPVHNEDEGEAVANFAEFQVLVDDDQGIRADGNQIRISLLDLFKWCVEVFLMPSISATTGRFIRSGCAAALGLLRPGSTVSAVLEQALRMDHFSWCLIGGCSWVVAKDSLRLLYARFRKQQRMKLHIMNRSG